MSKLTPYPLQHVMKRWIIVMMIVLAFVNIMMVVLANVLYNREIKREYASMVELVAHLAYYEDHQLIQTYLEHYEHTHHVIIAFQDDGHQLIYSSTAINPSWTFTPLTYQDTLVGYVYLNFQQSWLSTDYVIFFMIFNGIMILVFSLILLFIHQSMQKLTHQWLHELHHVGDPSFSFEIDVIKEAHEMVMTSIAQEKQAKSIYEMHIKRLAHDIKTPLTSSMMYLEGLMNKRLKYDEHVVQEIMDELHHIDRLIPQFITKNIKEIASLQDLSLSIPEMIPRYHDVLMTKDIQLSTHLEPLEVMISLHDLQTILDHLIFNAFYYSNPHQPMVIETHTHERTLSIIDQGIGMDDETISKLTKEVTRGPSAQHYHTKGSGMGYMILGDLMMKLHAKLEIQSRINEGTTVTIHFPFPYAS